MLACDEFPGKRADKSQKQANMFYGSMSMVAARTKFRVCSRFSRFDCRSISLPRDCQMVVSSLSFSAPTMYWTTARLSWSMSNCLNPNTFCIKFFYFSGMFFLALDMRHAWWLISCSRFSNSFFRKALTRGNRNELGFFGWHVNFSG